MDASEEILSRHDAARRASVTYNTILLWERAGRLHPVTVKRGRRQRSFIVGSELERVMGGSEQPFDPKLVWNETELQNQPMSVEPDPDPDRQPY